MRRKPVVFLGRRVRPVPVESVRLPILFSDFLQNATICKCKNGAILNLLGAPSCDMCSA